MAVAALALIPGLAAADFATAVTDYGAGRFGPAREEFERLAALGDGASQFNLGAMYLRGEGVEKNAGKAVGLLQAAAGNGYAKLSAEKLAAMAGELTPAEHRTADAMIARYGHEALRTSVLPEGRSYGGCTRFSPARRLEVNRRLIPTDAPDNVLLLVRVMVGRDGVARDPEIIYSTGSGLSAELVSRLTDRLLLRAHFKPAEVDGQPVEAAFPDSFRNIRVSDNVNWFQTVLGGALTQARAGDPQGQFAIGVASQHRQLEKVSPEVGRALLLRAAQGGYAPAQYNIARALQDPAICADTPRALVWFRAAAQEGSASAQVALAGILLSGQPGASEVTEAIGLLRTALTSTDPYALRHALGLLASHPAAGTPDGAALVEAANRLEHLEHAHEPQSLDAMASAYAAAGRFDRALEHEQQAIKFATALGWNTRAMEQRLANYGSRQIWRGDLFEVPPRDSPLPPPPAAPLGDP